MGIVGRARRAIRRHDRRWVIDVAEVHADRLPGALVLAREPLAYAPARCIPLRARRVDVGIARAFGKARVIEERNLGRAAGSRPALELVAVEKMLPAPALQRGGELPAEVKRVLQARVHAQAAIRRMRVAGIAGEKHPSVHEPVGDRHLAYPDDLVLDRVVHGAAEAAAHHGVDVDLVHAVVVVTGRLQAKEILAVDQRKEGPRALRADEHIAPRLLRAVQGEELGNAQVDVHRHIDLLAAANLDTEQLAHAALRAVAADEVRGADAVAAAALAVDHVSEHRFFVLHEGFELGLIAQLVRSERARAPLQDRIEPGLRTRLRALGTEARCRVCAERRCAQPAELIAVEVGDEHAVQVELLRETPVAHFIGHAEAPAELHRAHADLEHPRAAHLVGPPLDQQGLDAEASQVRGEREPDGPGTHDQDRHMNIEVIRHTALHSRTLMIGRSAGRSLAAGRSHYPANARVRPWSASTSNRAGRRRRTASWRAFSSRSSGSMWRTGRASISGCSTSVAGRGSRSAGSRSMPMSWSRSSA